MPEFLLRLVLLTVVGILAYDIAQTGSIYKSKTYKGLTENGMIKKSFSQTILWTQKNILTYYNETCVYLYQYVSLSQYFLLVAKRSATSLIKHTGKYALRNYRSASFKRTKKVVKKSARIAKKKLKDSGRKILDFILSILDIFSIL